MTPICPYCASPALLVTGADIYKRRPDLAALKFWRCEPCGAYVGCHRYGVGYGDGTRPLGRLANAELRIAKKTAHAVFDPIWKDGMMKRREAYAWLADAIGTPIDQTHIGEFDVGLCNDVIDACESRKKAARKAQGAPAVATGLPAV